MEKIATKFTYCDERFHVYLGKVLQRLPQDVQNKVLSDETLQIVADEGFHEACVLRYDFKTPLKTLLYFNTKGLKEPEHRIVYGIACEIARHVLQTAQTPVPEDEINALLVGWGFGKEMQAVRYDQAMAESQGYRIGYGWALKQSKDYLLQHFGIFFDQWNEKGFGDVSQEELSQLDDRIRTDAVLAGVLPEQTSASTSGPAKAEKAISQRSAMIAGIMAAIKEIVLQELYSAKTCAARTGRQAQEAQI